MSWPWTGFGRLSILLLAGTILLGALPRGTAAQRPRIGIGIGAGIMLGNRLIEQRFTSDETAPGELTQQVDLRETPMGSLHLEWYATRFVALRVQAARGTGRLEARTFTEDRTGLAMEPYETGFDHVRLNTLDAGIAVWPWAPGTIGFAPFLTISSSTLRYDFGSASADEFFRASGGRRHHALAIGGGADMHVWRSIMLRLEAVSQRVASPLRPDDFALFGDAGTSRRSRSNVRLLLGGHVYLPFRQSDAVPH